MATKQVFGFPIGSCGAYYDRNDRVFLAIGVQKRDLERSRQAVCNEAMKGSYEVWHNFVSGKERGNFKRQWNHESTEYDRRYRRLPQHVRQPSQQDINPNDLRNHLNDRTQSQQTTVVRNSQSGSRTNVQNRQRSQGTQQSGDLRERINDERTQDLRGHLTERE